jgi:pimeloyl-ACP methyl ester carboxylesterase
VNKPRGRNNNLTDYVLVHGAWGGGDGYAEIAQRLRAAGHRVHIAALTGLGERASELSPAITLSVHISDVAAAIDAANLTDFILVGHSYGGMIISAIAARRATQIRALVYIDAFLPRDGEALWDIATDWERQHYIDAQRDAPGLVAPFPKAPPHLTRHPLLTLLEPVVLTGDEEGVKLRIYIYAKNGAPKTFGKFYVRTSADSAWHTHALDSGHGVMQDAPDALFAILMEEGAYDEI